MIVIGSHPVQLQLAVIIGGCSPDVEVHGLVQDFLAVEGHLGKHTGELIVLVSKGLGADGDVTVAFGGGDGLLTDGLCFPNLQGSLVPVICIFQLDFVEAQVEALGQDLVAFFSL